MRVLHIVKTVVGATWALRQVRVLQSLGIEVTVALPSETEGLASQYRESGAKLIPANLDFPAREPWRLPSVLAACRRAIDEAKPDLIHSHHVGTTMVMRLAMPKKSDIPRIFQVPGPLHLEHALFARSEVALADTRDYWIAACEWTHRKYKQLGIAGTRVFLSYYGTEIGNFGTQTKGKLRRELGIADAIPLIGMVAYMYAPKWFLGQRQGLKGHEDFIGALKLARTSRPEIRGVIIGGAWNHAHSYENRLRGLGAAECGDALTFLGTRSDVAQLYPDLGLAVVPSHSENLGGAAEASLSGVPVVATKVGGLPDLIHDGAETERTGWLVPPHNPDSLARAILQALEDRDDARRRAVAAQKLALHMLDVERTGCEVASVYESILAGRSDAVNAG